MGVRGRVCRANLIQLLHGPYRACPKGNKKKEKRKKQDEEEEEGKRKGENRAIRAKVEKDEDLIRKE